MCAGERVCIAGDGIVGIDKDRVLDCLHKKGIEHLFFPLEIYILYGRGRREWISGIVEWF